MKRVLYITMLVIAMMGIAQCNPLNKLKAQDYPINYTELMNYYVRSNVETKKLKRVIFNDETEFRKYFGEAPVMGRNGQPTPIDFKTQFVVAVIMPATDRATEVIPAEISQDGNKMVFNYRVKKGKKQGFLIVPYTAVAIDKPAQDSQFEINFKQL